jgi:hypothetical protein
MKKTILAICLISLMIGCGGDVSSQSEIKKERKGTIYYKNDTFIINKGESIKILSDDTTFSTFTDAKTAKTTIQVTAGSIEVSIK